MDFQQKQLKLSDFESSSLPPRNPDPRADVDYHRGRRNLNPKAYTGPGRQKMPSRQTGSYSGSK